MNLDIGYLVSVFIRRLPYFIAVTAIFASIGLTAAVILPAEYEAQATLLVESEQIPEDLAASTVQTETAEALQIIQRRLMTRETLLDIADRLDLYQDPETGNRTMSASAIVSDMRSRASFVTESAGGGRRGRGGATIMHVGYRDESPGMTAEVVNEFVTLLLEENVELRTEQAGETLEFFKQEVERLSGELDSKSAQVMQFKSEAGVAIPENLDYLRNRLSSLEERLQRREQDIASLQEQKKRMTAMFELTGGVSEGQSPLQRELEAAREELANAELIFSDQNPKLELIRSKVERLENQVAQRANSAEAEAEQDAQVSREEAIFNIQIDEIDTRIQELRAEIPRIEAEIEKVEKNIAQANENGSRLGKLERELSNLQSQYNQANARLSAAETGERIELLSKGQRISVMEQAVVPNAPSRPNRPLIAGAGAGFGMAAGLGLIVLLELLNRSIRRPVELTNRLGITPIAVLPYIRTEREVRRQRLALLSALGVLLIGVPAALYGVHAFLQPLDILIEPFMNKLGFSITG